MVQPPVSEAELEQITRLVQQAMGYSEARGDALEIVNSPFTEQEEEIVVEEWWQSAGIQGPDPGPLPAGRAARPVPVLPAVR